MKVSDWLTILAILLSPLVALQLSSLIDAGKEKRRRKLWVFGTLMATRNVNARVSQEHVRALNSIDIEFADKPEVTDSWMAYLDHLNSNHALSLEAWGLRTEDLLVDLLYSMGKVLGFKFGKTHLKRGIYSPRAQGEMDEDWLIVRKGLVAIAKGEHALRVDLSEITHTPEENASAAAAKKATREVFTGERPLRVRVEKDAHP